MLATRCNLTRVLQALQREVEELHRRLLQSEERLRSTIEEHERELCAAQAQAHKRQSDALRGPMPTVPSRASLAESSRHSDGGLRQVTSALPEVSSDEAMLLMVQDMIGPDGSTPGSRRAPLASSLNGRSLEVGLVRAHPSCSLSSRLKHSCTPPA
jgi:hypothetical protein